MSEVDKLKSSGDITISLSSFAIKQMPKSKIFINEEEEIRKERNIWIGFYKVFLNIKYLHAENWTNLHFVALKKNES